MGGAEQISVAFLLFPKVTQLDLTGPAQVLSRLGFATIHLVAKTVDPVRTDAGFSIVPTATFAEIPSADVLCVPGGFGDQDAIDDDETLTWVRRVGERAAWVTSVCTGSIILGAAGLLQGYRATSHWSSVDDLALFGAEPVRERVVFDRNRVTGGGVTAGIDFALALTATLRGEEHARLVQLSLEYDPSPPFDSGSPNRVSDALLEKYHVLASKSGGDRAGRRRLAAQRLGFEPAR